MAKKRTKAQRRAAALASWERRRKGLPPVTPQKGKRRKQQRHTLSVAELPPAIVAEPAGLVRYISQPRIAYVVREGDDIFVCFAHDGSINREKITRETALKLLRDLSAAII